MPAPSISLIRTSRSGIWKLPLSRTELTRCLAAMLEAADLPQAQLELLLVDEAAMEALNRAYLGCAGPTNILSFPSMGDDDPFAAQDASCSDDDACSPHSGATEPTDLGSLALAPETVLRECLLYGQEPEPHTVRLLAHGLAHLLGHDHGPAMDALSQSLEEAAQQRLL